MARYGEIHQVADFVARSLSKKKAPFTHELLELLKDMSAIQESNASLTLAVQTGDGLRIVYDGVFLSLIIPQHKHVRVLAEYTTAEGKKLRNLLDSMVKDDIAEEIGTENYSFWRVFPGSVDTLTSFFRKLPGERSSEIDVSGSHPRNFPGPVRATALAEFMNSGMWCPGVGTTPRHKVNPQRDRIAFDHILPYAKGGSSNEGNIQVLCMACNSRKRDTAY